MSYSSKNELPPLYIYLSAALQLRVSVVFVLVWLLAEFCGPAWSQTYGLHTGNRAEFANLVYDAAAGNVILNGNETDSGNIISFAMTIADGQQPLNLEAVNFPFEDTGRNTDALAFQVGQFADASDAVGFESHVLGSIFPNQMSLDQLQDYLDTAIYASEFGVGRNFDAFVLQDLNRGDFTGDRALNGSDVSLLCRQIASNDTSVTFDITGDLQLDSDDLSQLLMLANVHPGDADLNGEVGFEDFLTLALSFGATGVYTDGDFNCNGTVDFADFLTLALNFESSIMPRLAGDIDGDGVVEFLDFLALASAFGVTCSDCAEDLNANGTVDFPDFLILANNFGARTVDVSVAVPEPSSFGILYLCAMITAFLTRARRRFTPT